MVYGFLFIMLIILGFGDNIFINIYKYIQYLLKTRKN